MSEVCACNVKGSADINVILEGLVIIIYYDGIVIMSYFCCSTTLKQVFQSQDPSPSLLSSLAASLHVSVNPYELRNASNIMNCAEVLSM